MKIMLDTNILISAFVFGGKVRNIISPNNLLENFLKKGIFYG